MRRLMFATLVAIASTWGWTSPAKAADPAPAPVRAAVYSSTDEAPFTLVTWPRRYGAYYPRTYVQPYYTSYRYPVYRPYYGTYYNRPYYVGPYTTFYGGYGGPIVGGGFYRGPVTYPYNFYYW